MRRENAVVPEGFDHSGEPLFVAHCFDEAPNIPQPVMGIVLLR
jgi:hypothetical protein